MRFGERTDDLKYSWRLCRKARRRGKNRPVGSYPLVSGTDTGYLWRNDGKVFIVADGSDNLLEWIKDLMWFRWGRDKVALGFLKAAVDFADQAESLLYPFETVIGLGHSRGAFVQKTVLELSRRGYCCESVITYGGMKLGGREFCESMQEEDIFHVRVYAPLDPVPNLPKFRGKQYESVAVTFPEKRWKKLIPRYFRIVRGIVAHVSYGVYLKGESIWKSSVQ